MRHETNIINYFLFGGWGWGWVGPYGFMEKMGDDTNMNIYVFGGGGGSRRTPAKIRQDIKAQDELRKNAEGNACCVFEECTILHRFLMERQFQSALNALTDAEAVAKILAIAPKRSRCPGNSALHFLAFAWSVTKVGNTPEMQKLMYTLCRLCEPLLNHRNASGKTALHMAAAHGNGFLVTALLEARAGFIFNFILN